MAPLRTLHQALDAAARSAAGYCFSTADDERWRSYASMREQALRMARSLRDAGIRPRDLVALILPDAEPFLAALLGTSLSGATPASFAPPSTTVGLPRYVERMQHILRASGARAIVTTARVAAAIAAHPSPHVPLVLVVDELDGAGCEPDFAATLEDIALVQFTSGSTASPKAVTLTHGNLAANIDAFGGSGGIAISRDDIGVSWLPLSHDMGLVGMALGALYAARPCVLLPPHEFVKRPVEWLRAITRHRGTVSFAPNFAYELCARRINDVAELNLSSWRVAGCGAEPIHAATLAAFAAKFSGAGFRDTSYVPCYGLAEHVLAVTLAERGRRPRVEYVAADGLLKERVAVPAVDGGRTVALVSCGRALPGHQLRIVADDGRALPERHVGEIQLAGPSLMAGYHNEPALNAETIRDGWLRTGDLGYLAGDELFVCGRAKDVVIVHGRKYQPEDLEWAVEHAGGVRPGRAVAFASTRDGVDNVVVVVDLFGLVVEDVVVVRSGTIGRTTSGKVQRWATRERYERGELRV
jgi:acyl-CoA synthetase (AMP-forming)/AMP-acid ligase II